MKVWQHQTRTVREIRDLAIVSRDQPAREQEAASDYRLKMPSALQELLRCPTCESTVQRHGQYFACVADACGSRFPIVDGVPVLIDERKSIFTLDDFTQQRETYFARPSNMVVGAFRRCLPELGVNLGARRNYAHFARLLRAVDTTPRVLVLGGSIVGDGMEDLLSSGNIQFIESDVSFGPRTVLIADAHDIPFADGSFDAVIAQAVLEHVIDPYRCVEEIHRVLKPNGVIYAETPFMQQVHGGRYDFTRFTHLGHRRLFRRFEEVESGAIGGPGAALAWSNLYFLLSFARSTQIRAVLRLIARLVFFPLKYADPYLLRKAGTLDAAWGYYFLGRRSAHTLPDRELIALYRGAL